MDVKKYRVICWQPQGARDDKVYVDIAPEDGVIHDMMFYSRLRLYRATNPNKMINDVAKSVYLSVAPGKEPEIEFSQRPYLPEDVLKQVILQTYRDMKESGRESTLANIMSAYQTEAYKDEVHGVSADERDFMRRQAKKRALIEKKTEYYAQTPQQQREKEESQSFKRVMERRKMTMNYREQQDKEMDPIERMRQRMQRFSGD